MLNKDILLAASKIKTYNIIRGTVSNVSLSYSPQTDIKAGTTVNITVTPNSGYQNPSVSVTKNDGTGGVTVSGSGNTRSFVMPKSDVTISASASVIPTYTVTGKATGGGISFSKTSGIRAGETITVYLSPNAYYTLSSLTSSPSVGFSGSGNTRTFVMPNSNVTVSATFVANWTHIITVGKNNTLLGFYYSSGYQQGDLQPRELNLLGYTNNINNLRFRTTTREMTINIYIVPLLDNIIPTLYITRLDTNLRVAIPEKKESSYNNYYQTNLSVDFFTEADVGKRIYLKISNV